MTDFKFALGVLILSIGGIALLSLVIWMIILFKFLDEIDGYFDSPDFPSRGYKGIWPWGMGRAMAYGVFLLFHNSWFVRKKFPYAKRTINIDEVPKKIKLMVAFPMYTNIPSSLFILVAGMMFKIRDWFF